MNGRRMLAGVAGLALLLGVTFVPAVQPTDASFTDPDGGERAAVTVTATTIPAPVASCGLLGVGSVVVNWTAVPNATGYVVHYGANGTSSATVGAGTTSRTLSGGLLSNGRFSVEAIRNFGSTTWTSASSNVLPYTIVAVLVATCGLV